MRREDRGQQPTPPTADIDERLDVGDVPGGKESLGRRLPREI